MSDINEIYPSGGNYVKTTDIKAGDILECEVAKAEVKAIKGQEKPKVVLTLVSGKEFPLNVTNARALATRFNTPDFSKWAGQKFKLIRQMTSFQGNPVEGLRVL